MVAYQDHRDGTWRYRKLITLPNGKKKRITGTPAINTKAAAEDAEREHINRLLHPERIVIEPEPKTIGAIPLLREFVKRFLEEYAPNEGSERSRASRELLVTGAIVPFFGVFRLDHIDQSHVNAFIASCKGQAAQTINNKLSALSTLLGYAADVKLIPPCTLKLHIKTRRVVETDDDQVDAVEVANVAKLIDVAPDSRFRVAVRLAAEAGLRIGEVRGLQRTDFKQGRITVRRSIDSENNIGPPKNGKQRSIPLTLLSPALVAEVEALPRVGIWLISRDDGNFMPYKRMLRTIEAMYVAAKVPPNAMPWHSLRHTFGTELAARNVPLAMIQRLMGHADIKTTMRYISVHGDQLDAALARAFNR